MNWGDNDDKNNRGYVRDATRRPVSARTTCGRERLAEMLLDEYPGSFIQNCIGLAGPRLQVWIRISTHVQKSFEVFTEDDLAGLRAKVAALREESAHVYQPAPLVF